MTAIETTPAYAREAGFQGWLAAWVENRRCPLELVDWLLDRGLEAQAERARWAATLPERIVYSSLYVKSAPFPWRDDEAMVADKVRWYWFRTPHSDYADDLPGTEEWAGSDTAEDALMWFLENAGVPG